MARPTEEAKFHFAKADKFANSANLHYSIARGRQQPTPTELGDRHLTRAVRELAMGLDHLSDGLRATYILVEELKAAGDRKS